MKLLNYKDVCRLDFMNRVNYSKNKSAPLQLYKSYESAVSQGEEGSELRLARAYIYYSDELVKQRKGISMLETLKRKNEGAKAILIKLYTGFFQTDKSLLKFQDINKARELLLTCEGSENAMIKLLVSTYVNSFDDLQLSEKYIVQCKRFSKNKNMSIILFLITAFFLLVLFLINLIWW